MFAFSLSTFLCVLLVLACFHVHFFTYLRESLCRRVPVHWAYCIHVCPCMCVFRCSTLYILICMLCGLVLVWSWSDLFCVYVCVCFYGLCVCGHLHGVTSAFYVCVPSPFRWGHTGSPLPFQVPHAPNVKLRKKVKHMQSVSPTLPSWPEWL